MYSKTLATSLCQFNILKIYDLPNISNISGIFLYRNGWLLWIGIIGRNMHFVKSKMKTISLQDISLRQS